MPHMNEAAGEEHSVDITLVGPNGEDVHIEVKANVEPATAETIKAAAEALKAAQAALEKAGVHISNSKAAVERARTIRAEDAPRSA